MKKANEVAQTTATSKKSEGFTDAEKAAMQERSKELKAESKRGKKADGEADVLAKIAEMEGLDRTLAQRIHEIMKANAPELSPKTWYGMPAYANANGKVVCFFQAAQKFDARYATFGFNDTAHLDDGDMWAASFAVMALTPAVEEKIIALVKKAVS